MVLKFHMYIIITIAIAIITATMEKSYGNELNTFFKSMNSAIYYSKDTFSNALNTKLECIFKEEFEEKKRQEELELIRLKICDEKFNIFHDGLKCIVDKIVDPNNTDMVITQIINLSIDDICIAKTHHDYDKFIESLCKKNIDVIYWYDDDYNATKMLLSFAFDISIIYGGRLTISISSYVE